MPRFDVYRNPNPRATHSLLLDVQSDLVRTPVGQVNSEEQLLVESAIDFMLRGY